MMKRVGYLTFLALVSSTLLARNFDGSTSLSSDEQRELRNRVLSFYRHPDDPAQMDVRPPKYNLLRGQFVHPHAALGPSLLTWGDPLLASAGFKADGAFQRYQCEHFYRKHFPGLRCGDDGPTSRAVIEQNDLFADLVDGWMDDAEVVYDLARAPIKGQIANDVWSADYWQMRWGLTSYRPSTGSNFPTYQQAITSYQQPRDWTALIGGLSPALWAGTIVRWSPAEKYDLTVGDAAFTLTNEQKGEGSGEIDDTGNVPDWVGLCDGWSAASIRVPAPTKPVNATGPKGAAVTWYPDDIRAMATLAWTNGNYDSHFIGGRCEEKKPATFPNGRLSAQECFDTNPATFHLTLANLIGIKSQPFVMDVSFDAEVWNQPVLSYEFTYFNPLDPTKTGSNWDQLAVPYDATFKAKDRFQSPLTRGVRGENNRYDDSHILRVVGVNATVVYLDESVPNWGVSARPNNTERVTYSYDLELTQEDGRWIPVGGEWHANTHPDFLWIPAKDSIASGGNDDVSLSFALDKPAGDSLTRTATVNSKDAFPLCSVLKTLVESSHGQGAQYQCGALRNSSSR